MKIDRLIRIARATAFFNGHTMPKFTHSKDGTRADAECTRCNMYVTARAKARCIGDELSGTAYYLKCTHPARR